MRRILIVIGCLLRVEDDQKNPLYINRYRSIKISSEMLYFIDAPFVSNNAAGNILLKVHVFHFSDQEKH